MKKTTFSAAAAVAVASVFTLPTTPASAAVGSGDFECVCVSQINCPCDESTPEVTGLFGKMSPVSNERASVWPWPPENCNMLPPPACPKPYRMRQEQPIPVGSLPYVLAGHEIYVDWKLETSGGQNGGSISGGYKYTW